jgi:hypothetical protein
MFIWPNIRLEESYRHTLPRHLVVPICQFASLIRLFPQLFNQSSIIQPDPLRPRSRHVFHRPRPIGIRQRQTGSKEGRKSDEPPQIAVG